MKIEYKVIALSIIIGLLFWVIDAVVDYFYFYQEPFQNVLIPEASSFELYIRLTWTAFFFIFGLITSRIIAKRKQTEEELLKFKMGIERSNEAVFITDINGTIIYANPAFEKIYGFSKEEVLGKTPRILKSGVHSQEIYKQFWDTLFAKKVVTGEIINKAKDGRLLNTESSANPILDKDGNITGFLAIQHDITERKKAELEYKTLLKTALDGFYVVDTRGHILDVNDSYCNMIGYSRDELLIMNIKDVDSIETEEQIAQRISRILEVGWDRFETCHRCKDGRVIKIEASVNYINSGIGKFFVFMRDITERKLSETALRESEERYRKLVEFSPDAISIHREGKIVFINVAGVKLLGAVNPEQLIGKSVLDFVHPDYKEIARERIRLMGEEGKNVSPVEEKLIKLDGSVINAEVIAMPFTYQGKPGVQVIIRDITDRKRAEEALKQSEEKYRTLIDNIQDGVFIIQDAKIQFANESFARIGGYTVEEVIGKDFQEFVAPEDYKMVVDRYYRRQEGEEVPKEYEFHALHKDGVTRILVNTNVGLITFHSRLALVGL